MNNNETDFSEVLKFLEDKIQTVEDAEAINSYQIALDNLGYGLQAEYLEKDSERYDL